MFQGSMCAIITPWKDGRLDRDALANLLEFQIANGTKALVPVGTTGESATMTHAEHEQVIAFTVEQARKRVPVIAGSGSNATSEALSLTQRAKELGADGALLISPYYNKPTQEGLYQHYKHIAERVAIPMIVYNCPGRTGSSVRPETVARLSAVPNIVALKDAEANIDYTSEVVSLCDIAVLSGNDSMNLPIIALGGKGAISVLANIAPRAVANIVDLALASKWADALALHKKWFKMCQTLFIESNPIPVKAAGQMMGLCNGELRMPLLAITDAGRERLRAAMAEAGLLDAAPAAPKAG